MATPTEILTLTQWFSPAFPVGSFAYSHGLEWAVAYGDVADAPGAEAWIETVLRNGAGWNDCILLAASYRAEDDTQLAEIDETARALAASRERLQETDLQGAAFCAAVSGVSVAQLAGLTYPVAAGRAARLAGLPLELTAQMYLHGVMSNLAAIAMRAVPLGQSAGQGIIQRLAPVSEAIAAEASRAGLDDLSASAFQTDIASMRHETQYSRSFRT